MYANLCNICQQFKNRQTIYGRLLPKNIWELKPWYIVHVHLVGSYSKSIICQQPGGAIINSNISLAWMAMIDPATGWFEIFKLPTLEIDKVTVSYDEYIYNSYVKLIHLFNNKFLCIYPRSCRVMFHGGYEFEWDFTNFLKDFDIKPVSTTIKNPQANIPVERVH